MIPSFMPAALAEQVHCARQALDAASSETVIDTCKKYLGLLAEYRAQLHLLKGESAIDPRSAADDVCKARRTVRVAIEQTTQERNRCEALLLSFTNVSGYQAVEVLNQTRYLGHDNWEMRAGGVKAPRSAPGDLLTIQQAVDAASRLRREAYAAKSAVDAGGPTSLECA